MVDNPTAKDCCILRSSSGIITGEALKRDSSGDLMAMKVLKNEGGELRIRISGEDHTTLHVFRTTLTLTRTRLLQLFFGHPDLDDPELISVRTKVKTHKDPEGSSQGCR